VTKKLQLLFIFTLLLILIFWFGDLFLGTPAKVSDNAITEGWADDDAHSNSELINARLLSLIYAIPTLLLLLLTIKSYRLKDYKLFFGTFLFGMTLFQIISVFGFFKVTDNAPGFLRPVLAVLFILFLAGQIVSVYKLYKLRDQTMLVGMKN